MKCEYMYVNFKISLKDKIQVWKSSKMQVHRLLMYLRIAEKGIASQLSIKQGLKLYRDTQDGSERKLDM